MTFNFMSANFLSRAIAGTVTLVTILGMIPGLAQASSQQLLHKNNELPIKNDDPFGPADIDIMSEIQKIMAETSYNMGNSLMEKKDFQGAIEQYNQTIEIYSEYAEAYTNRAIAKTQIGDKSGAIADLQQAATLFQQQGNTQAYQQIQQVLQQAR
jgi:tetratricopeptide (TPR) repeat protein